VLILSRPMRRSRMCFMVRTIPAVLRGLPWRLRVGWGAFGLGSGGRDGDTIHRRAGASDQPTGRRRDSRRLRTQRPTAQSSRLKGPELFGSVYMSRDLLAAWRAGAADRIRWIVRSRDGVSDWAREGEIPTVEVPFRTTDAEAQIVAVRQGFGMTTLPCFVGDADKLLVRVPGTALCLFGTLWLLTQGETRKTKRVRLFTEFVSRGLAGYVPLLAGLAYSSN
jgi:DNA-binding transcriptional LysR family regulator